VIFQLDVVHNWPKELPKNQWMKTISLCRPEQSIVIHKPQNDTGGVAGAHHTEPISPCCACSVQP
jgi:hypothetical protein